MTTTTTFTEEMLDVATTAQRLGVTEDQVRTALRDRQTLDLMRHQRGLSEDAALLLTIANLQAQSSRDDVVVLPI